MSTTRNIIEGIKNVSSDVSAALNTKANQDTTYTKTEVDSKPTGFKNYIINGNFDVWQRGTSQTIDGYGSDDRWFNGNLGSTKTHSQVACTDVERALFNDSKFSRTVVSSVVDAGNFVVKRQSIEDVTKLAGKTVTLSFWAKADSNKNIWLEFKQYFGSGGSPSPTVTGIYGQAIALTSTWQKKTITLTLPTISGKTLGTDGVHTSSTELQFWFNVGSSYIARIPTGIQQSGTFEIAQVQLEEGSVATPFENRPYGLELSLCKRYYVGASLYTAPMLTWANSGDKSTHYFSVQMRVAPTVIIYGDAIYSTSVGALPNGVTTTQTHQNITYGATKDYFEMTNNVSSSVVFCIRRTVALSAEL